MVPPPFPDPEQAPFPYDAFTIEPHAQHRPVLIDDVEEATLAWRVTVQGKMFRLQHRLSKIQARGGKPRGQIRGFTDASRLRLLRYIATVKWNEIQSALLCTLTYPDEIAARSPRRRTQDRLHFFAKVERKIGVKIPALWRLEWKDRLSGRYKGKLVPHFHLLLFGVPFIAWQDVRRWWGEVLQFSGRLATDIRRANTATLVALYAAKYAAKRSPSSSLDNQSYVNRGGRCWGIFRKASVPLEDQFVWPDIAEEDARALQEAAGQVLKYYDPRVNPGFTILGNASKRFRDLLVQLGLDGFAE